MFINKLVGNEWTTGWKVNALRIYNSASVCPNRQCEILVTG